MKIANTMNSYPGAPTYVDLKLNLCVLFLFLLCIVVLFTYRGKLKCCVNFDFKITFRDMALDRTVTWKISHSFIVHLCQHQKTLAGHIKCSLKTLTKRHNPAVLPTTCLKAAEPLFHMQLFLCVKFAFIERYGSGWTNIEWTHRCTKPKHVYNLQSKQCICRAYMCIHALFVNNTHVSEEQRWLRIWRLRVDVVAVVVMTATATMLELLIIVMVVITMMTLMINSLKHIFLQESCAHYHESEAFVQLDLTSLKPWMPIVSDCRNAQTVYMFIYSPD